MNKERNKIIANNIRKYLKETKMTQKQLAELIDVKPSTLSDYLNLRSNPSHGVIQKIADVFGIVKSDIDTTYKEDNDITTVYNQLTPPRQHNVLEFANHQLELQNSTDDNVIDLDTYKNDNTTEIAVNGYVSAGTGEQIFDEPMFKVNIKGYVPPHDIALQVNGNSMEPMFNDKEIIFVEKSNNIKNGQIGVFIINGESYVKKVHVGEDRLTLISLNKNYRDLHFYENEGVELVGKVIL